MKYYEQIEALKLLARRGTTEAGTAPPSGWAAYDVAQWLSETCPDPRAFITGACARGWMVLHTKSGSRETDSFEHGSVGLSGQLLVLMRSEWAKICPSMRPWIVNLTAVLERCTGESILDMDDLADQASIDAPWRDLVWSTVLSAIPGLAKQTSTRGSDGRRTIRLAPDMLDAKKLMHLIDVERPLPHYLALPLEVVQ